MIDLNACFEKHYLKPEEFLYIYHKNRKTVICTVHGEEIELYAPVRSVLEFLPKDDFLNISKGVVVRRDRIVGISRDGVYTMADGQTFQGRKRDLSTHRRLGKELEWYDSAVHSGHIVPLSLLEKCTLLDDMPIAYCIIELVFNEEGHGIDFIFRYCNKQMAVIEGVSVEEMINHSFYEVFRNGDKKWLVAYADVALNGTQRILRDYSPEIGKTLTIACYQPEPGFCACILQTTDPDVLCN